MNLISVLSLLFIAVLLSGIATGYVLKYLRRKAILDLPNERSSHTIPTPRGGGWGVLACLVPLMIFLAIDHEIRLPAFDLALAGVLVLAAISWLDDLKGLKARGRFLGQFIVVAMVIWFLPETAHGYIGNILPLWAEKVILLFGWVWFVNLYNFMDGIDGISGVETASLGLGIACVAILCGFRLGFVPAGVVFCGAALGFLWWNWHPAKVFLGDVGSVPLGYLLGFFLISLAGQGQVIAALILPLYYLSDATITLFRRALRKEKIWLPHREHFYQKATQRGLAHNEVSFAILLANLMLIGWALLSTQGYELFALGGAALTMVGLYFYLIRWQSPARKGRTE